MIEAGRPRAGTRLTTKRDRFAYRARVGVSRVFRARRLHKPWPSSATYGRYEIDMDSRIPILT